MQEKPQGNREHSVDAGTDGGAILDRALQLVRFLRSGCPWDAKQTHGSLRAYLIEETLELVDAITDGDDAAMRDELGDLLLNVAFQIVVAEERGAFDAEDVVGRLEAKMRRRHPHLYGEAEDRPGWEEMKAHERAEQDIFDGLARRLDPLSRAHRLQDRAAGVGFDWEDHRGAFEKLQEEVAEVEEQLEAIRSEELERELGDLLFSCVNVARLAGVHASRALRDANARFKRRFRIVQRLARERGLDMADASLAELDELWEEAKGM